MAERISSLRRRMIEDMKVRNLSPTLSDPISTTSRSLVSIVSILVGPRIVLGLSTFAPTKFIWCRAALLGRHSTKSSSR
jgi:hypothetical protein